MTALADSPVQPQSAQPKKPGGYPIPPDISDSLKRGRQAANKDKNLRRLCHKFWKGEHYWYQNPQGALRVLATALVDISGGKPGHRIRNTYNFIQAITEAKVSAATVKTPGYEVGPSSPDLEDVAAARISEQLAIWGYDKWYVRRARTKVFTTAFVQREGFAMPYYDGCVGPYTEGPDGEMRGRGEIKIETFNRSEVLWEEGVEFMDSPWHAVDRAVLISKIQSIPGYIGGKLTPSGSDADLPSEKRSNVKAVLTDYMERPSAKYPNGRRCFIAGGKVIVDFRMDPSAPEGADWYEGYPYVDAKGVVCDEPVIHRLSYTVNPEAGEDDMGLVERLIDLMRTIDDCWNKLLEWKNRALMPRYKAPLGSNIRTNDVPGGVDYYKVNPINPDVKPELETPVPIPRELFDMLSLALTQLRALAADVDVQPEPRLTSDTASLAISQAQTRWDSFQGDAEEFDSRMMRHCLTLAARYYTEEQIIQIRGRHGWEPPITFTGTDLRSQVNVRVLEGSTRAKSRAAVLQDVEFMQKNFPGVLNPEAVWSAMHGGSVEGLLRTFQLDVAMAHDVATRLQFVDLSKPGALEHEFGWRQDMDFGDPAVGFLVPGWMPRKCDNVAIWKQVFGDFMKEDAYRRFPLERRHLYDMVFDGLDHQEMQRKLQMLQQEQGVAEQLGASNAAKPQTPIPLPQMAAMSPQQAAPDALSPRQ